MKSYLPALWNKIIPENHNRPLFSDDKAFIDSISVKRTKYQIKEKKFTICIHHFPIDNSQLTSIIVDMIRANEDDRRLSKLSLTQVDSKSEVKGNESKQGLHYPDHQWFINFGGRSRTPMAKVFIAILSPPYSVTSKSDFDFIQSLSK